ncbi:MAG: NAD(P)-dependent oxidoreductase [Cyanobacteria bacterium REEB459]|nr:NAD(P)-dependent oxidoreductase [Cyanobacteria bacterium REEB459]
MATDNRDRICDRPLLITGASGFLGWHLTRLASPYWSVQGTYHQHPVDQVGVTMTCLDLSDLDRVQAWLAALNPGAVIHTAALSQPNVCEHQPQQSYAINVKATCTLAEFCGQRSIPFVFTSTEQVFDGEAAPYSEGSTPRPINTYGQHKLEAEQRIQTLHPHPIICRLPLLYGPATPRAGSFLQGFFQTLAAGQPLSVFVDEFRSPAYVEDVALGLLLALREGVDLLHLGGPERISRYHFGLRIAEIFNVSPALLVPTEQRHSTMAARRPADLSTDNQRALALGYQPRDVAAGLRAVRDWSERTGPNPTLVY